MGEIFGKLILFIFGIVAMRFCLMIVDANEAQTARLKAERQMYHLAAYIQNDLGQGVVFDPAKYLAKLGCVSGLDTCLHR